MKAELKSLFDKKGKIVNEMKDAYRLVSERKGEQAGVATAEEKSKFTAWDSELVQIQEQIDFHQRMEKLDLYVDAGKANKLDSDDNKEKKYNDAATATERRNAINKANKVGYSALSDAERVIYDTDLRDVRAFEKFMRFGFNNLNAEDRAIVGSYQSEKRAQSVGTTTAGGFTVPEGFAGYITEVMVTVSELMNWANIINTATGNDIPFPINDDNSNTGELIGENSDFSSSSADLVFSSYTMKAYKMSSKLIKVSEELLQDTGVDLVGYMAKKLGIRVGKISNSYFTTGTGSAQPKGFLQTRGSVTSSTSTFTLAELAAFQDSIDPAYRSGNKVAWSMHSNLLSELKQLSIAATAYGQVWAPSFRDGEPDTILGKRYFLNQAMSSTSATGDKIFAYGDWSKFNIRMINGFELRRLTERYAEFGQTAFFGVARLDSALLDTTAVKYMEIS
jgi:HK97 family phage major capsid protein